MAAWARMGHKVKATTGGDDATSHQLREILQHNTLTQAKSPTYELKDPHILQEDTMYDHVWSI